jgi:hypothetical protein
MDDRARLVIEAVAQGVWQQHDGGFFAWSQCTFCCVSPESQHDDDCPVRIAKEILEDET